MDELRDSQSKDRDIGMLSLDLVSVLRSIAPFLVKSQKYSRSDDCQEHGHTLFMSSLVEEELSRPGSLANKVFVEIGSTRERVLSQGSTEKNAIFTASMNMSFKTVDIDPDNTVRVRKLLPHLNPDSEAITQKGEDYLSGYEGEIDYVYLDAFDFYHEHHSFKRQQRYYELLNTQINDEECWEMHRKCAVAIISKMPLNGMVGFDDTWETSTGEWGGKGKLAVPLFLENGFSVVAQDKTAIVLKRISNNAKKC